MTLSDLNILNVTCRVLYFFTNRVPLSFGQDVVNVTLSILDVTLSVLNMMSGVLYFCY